MSDDAPQWEAKAAFMRTAGATAATWDAQGNLLHIELGADSRAPEHQHGQPMTVARHNVRELLRGTTNGLVPRGPSTK